MKKIIENILTYTVVFEPAEEGGFIVTVPLLPGCTTQGETFEEAIKMAKDAISGYVTVLKENKNEIPLENQGPIITKVNIPNPVYSNL